MSNVWPVELFDLAIVGFTFSLIIYFNALLYLHICVCLILPASRQEISSKGLIKLYYTDSLLCPGLPVDLIMSQNFNNLRCLCVLAPWAWSSVSELFVSWCFEPSQTQRITSGLKTNFSLSPSYSVNKL